MKAAAPASAAPPLELHAATVQAAGPAHHRHVRDVTWRVEAGEFWLVTGPPGAGKSALLATLAGLYEPAAGALKLFGTDLSSAPAAAAREARTRVGLVFTGGRLLRHLTLAENIALPAAYRDAPEVTERAGEWLDPAGLVRWAGFRPTEVGPGPRLRAALVRALTLRPELLLLDEPLAALDPVEAAWWQDYLAGHTTLPLPATIILATHDAGPWRERAPRLASLHDKQWRVLPAGATDADLPAALRPWRRRGVGEK